MDYIILILILILVIVLYINKKNYNKVEKFSDFKENKIIKENIYQVGCNTDDDCNIVNGNGKNICKSDNKCYCIVGTGDFCQLGKSNFKNPETMNSEELKSFKENYSREKFSLQYYKNWLLLYKDTPKELSYDHLKNLNNINKIQEKDIPISKISPPETAAEYFNKMYKDNMEMIIEPLNSDTAGIVLASNFSDYSEFIPPQDISNYVIKNTDYKHEPISIDQCYMKINK